MNTDITVDTAARAGITDYGFVWGPMIVERVAHIPGRGYVLEVRTEHERVQIVASEKGRRLSMHPLGPERFEGLKP